MAKRTFIVHGWDGHPAEGWLPWLQQELEERGFVVTTPAMPNPRAPVISSWMASLAHRVGALDAVIRHAAR